MDARPQRTPDVMSGQGREPAGQTVQSASPATDWPEDRLLTRKEASSLARVMGVPLAVATLAKWAVRGGEDAPPIVYFRSKPLYRVADLKTWIQSRCVSARSTSEAASLRRSPVSRRREAAE